MAERKGASYRITSKRPAQSQAEHEQRTQASGLNQPRPQAPGVRPVSQSTQQQWRRDMQKVRG